MMRTRFALLALLLLGAPALATDSNFPTPGNATVPGHVLMCLNAAGNAVPNTGPYPCGATAVNAASGSVAAATATATLPAAAGKTTYICGFSITSTGSTAAAVVSPTVTNTVSATMTFTYASVAGATLANQPLVIPFNPCVPASAVNTTIPVALPSLGAGNTNATVNAWGFQL